MPDSVTEWVSTTPAEANKLEHRAIVGGHEGHDGSPLLVIRAHFEGELVPGKLAVKHKTAYVPWGGKENIVEHIEVCCLRRPHMIVWADASPDGSVPHNAVVGGRTMDGETLFIGRGGLAAPKTPGKVQPSHKVLYISYDGKEVALEHYEVMCGQLSPVEWITTTAEEAHKLADRAVVAGTEGYDGSPLWVIRANYQGDLLPGKLAIKHKAAYVPWRGEENAVKTFEVCCAKSENVKWQKGSQDGTIPSDASLAGYTSDGEGLYVGRAMYNGSLTPGKVHPSHRLLYITFEHKEVALREYDILCTVY